MITTAAARRLDFEAIASSFLQKYQSGFSRGPGGRLAFAGFLFFLCIVPLVAGPIVQYAYAHDAFIFLDGAWRVLNGQRPQVDFSTNLGPLIFLFTAAGIAIAKHGGYALVIAQVLFGALVGALAYWISVRRLPRAPAVAISSLFVLLCLAPYNVGEAPFSLTFGMMYNRIGYALLGVLLIEVARPPNSGPKQIREELMGGVMAGFICAFLLFLKITYFLSAVALIIALLPYRKQVRERFIGMAISGLVLTLCMLAYLRFDIPALFREYRMAVAGKHIPRVGAFELGIANIEYTILLLVLVSAFVWLLAQVRAGEMQLSRLWAVLVTATLGFGLLITNHQFTGEPLNAFVCVLIATEIAANSWVAWGRASFLVPAALILIGLWAPFIGLLLPTGISYLLPLTSKVVQWQDYTPEMRIDARVVSDFRSRDNTPRFYRRDNRAVWGNYAAFVNEGLALLRQYSSADESVMSLEFTNPFSYSLQRRPARGGTTCLHPGVTFDDTHRLSADQLFGDAKLVMLPKLFTVPLLEDAIARNYLKPLRERYRVVAESQNWTLFRRAE